MKQGLKHLSLAVRAAIMAGLDAGLSLMQIAENLGRPVSTISREIASRASLLYAGLRWCANQCVSRVGCAVTGLCQDCPARGAPCARCSLRNCNRVCKDFELIDCEKRARLPGKVCNGCPDRKKCRLVKHVYDAEKAQKDYETRLSECRRGLSISQEEIERLDGIISPAIKDGKQSLHHICVANATVITRNERTLARYLHDGVFSAKRHDMKRSCMVRSRKPKAKEYQHKVEKGCYVDRTHEDYEKFCVQNPHFGEVFMDLVIGRPGGVCMLTLHFVESAFMIARLIPNKCAQSVIDAFDSLYGELGHDLFSRLFWIVLTDRGTEFSAPSRLETAKDGTRRCNVFFCDPMNSNQKSQIERNHGLVREIFPKGTSFDNLTQAQLDLALSHVNACVRPSQSDRTPYEVFEFYKGAGVAEKLRISKIDPRTIVLSPRLVGLEM